MSPCRSERGSSTVEFCVLALFLIQLLAGCILICVLMMAHLWVHHQGHEALMCLAEGQRPQVCETTLRRKIHNLFPFGQIHNLHMRSHTRHWRVSFKWELKAGWHIHFSKRLDRNLELVSKPQMRQGR